VSTAGGGELGPHNKPEIRNEMIDPFYQQTEVLAPEDIADGIAYMVTRPRHTAIGELWIMPTEQLWPHPRTGRDERIDTGHLAGFPCSRKGWINGQLLMSNGGYA
jgi:hypothetical protein